MFRPFRHLFTALCLLALATAATGSDWWSRLELRDLLGAPLPSRGRWIVVVFLSPECPVANADIPVLNSLAADFTRQGFDFVGAYADPTIELPALRQHASDYHLAFATVDDRAHRLVRATGATYTPEVFVFTREGVRCYQGRIDDRVQDFGPARPAATHEDLRDVLTALAAGQSGPFEKKPGFGCSIPEPVRR